LGPVTRETIDADDYSNRPGNYDSPNPRESRVVSEPFVPGIIQVE
jgi:hypothetical protein